ncbi:hypothetical protein JXL19_00225 [bacterium]|nr:hypothetical protein [bacterium]
MNNITNEMLSQREKVQRLIYQLLRTELEKYLIKYALMDSYKNFLANNYPYPFVEKRELKPKAKVIEREYEYQNCFLVLFYEGTLTNRHKKYIRFLSGNKLIKENLEYLVDFKISPDFTQNMKYFDSWGFAKLFYSLLPADYALLIQKDPTISKRARYVLSHFHVKMDWPITDAAECLAKRLRYISKDLFENGERYAENLQQKLFEYYGFHHTAGGRRSAAAVASQYLSQEGLQFTIYVASKESRAMTKIDNDNVYRYVLMKLGEEDANALQKLYKIKPDKFRKNYVINTDKKDLVVIFLVTYIRTPYSTPPPDGKLRDLNLDYRWITIDNQLIVPLPDVVDARPIPYPTIYSV